MIYWKYKIVICIGEENIGKKEVRKNKADIDVNELIKENNYNLEMCKKYTNRYILIDNKYAVNLDL